MKICPNCSFSNEECFPTCVWCNTPLADVPYTPAEDPNHPEHERKALMEQRHAIIRRQTRFAALLYAASIALLAVVPGLVFAPHVLVLYFLSALAVAFAVVRGLAGQFTSALLQGILSVVLVLCFGPGQPLTFFMLTGHIILAVVLLHWVEMIHDTHR
jgi:hypothetical protein